MRFFSTLTEDQRLLAVVGAICAILIWRLCELPEAVEVVRAGRLSRSPLNDLDLSNSTDFEDSALVAWEMVGWAEQDYAVFLDGGHLGGLAATGRGQSAGLVR